MVCLCRQNLDKELLEKKMKLEMEYLFTKRSELQKKTEDRLVAVREGIENQQLILPLLIPSLSRLRL